MSRSYNTVVSVIEWLLIALFICMVASVFIQVVGRHVFRAPPFWTEEVARYVLIWISFVGAALAHHHKEHITVEIVPAALPRRVRAGLEAVISLIVIVLMVILVKAGWAIATTGTQPAPATGISLRYVYAALPVGAALMLVVSILHLWQDAKIAVTGVDDDAA